MPSDIPDKHRDEDETERRKTSRRRHKVGGRRSTDNTHLARLAKDIEVFLGPDEAAKQREKAREQVAYILETYGYGKK